MATTPTPLTDAEMNLLECGAEDTHRNRAAIRAVAEIRALRAELERVVVEVEPKDAGQGLGGSAAEVVRGAMYELDLWRSEGKALRAERDDLLAALKEIAEGYRTTVATCRSEARAAIARAEGRAEG